MRDPLRGLRAAEPRSGGSHAPTVRSSEPMSRMSSSDRTLLGGVLAVAGLAELLLALHLRNKAKRSSSPSSARLVGSPPVKPLVRNAS
jgi:hypothetical protein